MREDTSPTDREVAVAYLDAIRLGLEASANDASALALVQTLLTSAPATDTPETDTLSTRYLITAISELGAAVSIP